MNSSDNRNQKLAALQAAIEGNPQALLTYKTKRGRPNTAEELEERRQYLSQLYGYEASLKEVTTFFGRCEPIVGSAQGYVLPNGMRLNFQ